MSEFLARWQEKRDATEVIELSGGPARVKVHVTVEDLAAAGRIPMPLLAKIESLREEAERDPIAVAVENFDTLVEAYNAVAIAVFVDPPVTAAGGPDSLSVWDVPVEDRKFIFERASRRAAAYEQFRQSKGQPDGVTHPGDGVPREAVADAGN